MDRQNSSSVYQNLQFCITHLEVLHQNDSGCQEGLAFIQGGTDGNALDTRAYHLVPSGLK